MSVLIILFLPLAAAAATVVWRNRPAVGRTMLALAALGHCAATTMLIYSPGAGAVCDLPMVSFDLLGTIFVSIVSWGFLLVTLYLLVWLPGEAKHPERGRFEWLFVLSLLVFLSSMSLVCGSSNFGLLWVAVEATTLASAPLILFYRGPRAVEAMWKYLLICSVGIAFALFGTMLLAAACAMAGGQGLDFETLSRVAGRLDRKWFMAAFVFILAGYGTKMGLAPFHTWLPDAHSEAPGPVSALLSGVLLNCSFLGVVRVMNLAAPEMVGDCRTLLSALGLLSLATAAFFIMRQGDFKRMLGYSSVEHMGIIALLWGSGLWMFALLHLAMHSMIKMSLFLLAGNIFELYGSKQIDHVSGVYRSAPWNSRGWLFGIMMICALPPSPLFFTEYTLIANSAPWLGITVAVLLFAVFAGMSSAALRMSMGRSATPAVDAPAGATVETLALFSNVVLGFVAALGALLLFVWVATAGGWM